MSIGTWNREAIKNGSEFVGPFIWNCHCRGNSECPLNLNRVCDDAGENFFSF